MRFEDIPAIRLTKQHLINQPPQTPEETVRWLCAVQAQDYPWAKWALGLRTGATNAQINELFNAGRILRTHAMRPTWHFVDPADIRWLLALTGPRVHAVNAYYYRKFGLDETLLKKSEALLANILQGGKQLTRTEIAHTLKVAGITANGLQLGYILMSAELNAVICSGALSGKQHTYTLLDERAPKAKPPVSREEALARLATRYFASHSPAQLQDFSWWSGLTAAEAKTGIAGAKLEQFEQGGKTYWTNANQAAKMPVPTVHLLPNYDEYLIAYKDRSAYATTLIVTPPAEIFYRHILVVEGKVAGAWRVEAKGKELAVIVTVLVSLTKPQHKALEDAVELYGQFMATPARLVVA